MIEYALHGSIARVTLKRAEKRNALDQRMIAELHAAIETSAGESAARLVLITADGPDFCAGMDLQMMAQTVNGGSQEFLADAQRLAGLYRSLRHHPRPIVAAVRGRALGGGCGIAMACDAVLAAESSHFGFPEVDIGFVPAIVTALLRRSVGEKLAFDLLTSGQPVTARRACELGMITHVIPDQQFEAGVETYVSALAAKSASAIAMTKQQLYAIDGLSFDAALRSGVETSAKARASEDARRGFEQFAKRK